MVAVREQGAAPGQVGHGGVELRGRHIVAGPVARGDPRLQLGVLVLKLLHAQRKFADALRKAAHILTQVRDFRLRRGARRPDRRRKGGADNRQAA